MKRIKLINNVLDFYDGYHPLSGSGVISEKSDVRFTHELLDKMIYETGYIVCDEYGEMKILKMVIRVGLILRKLFYDTFLNLL